MQPKTNIRNVNHPDAAFCIDIMIDYEYLVILCLSIFAPEQWKLKNKIYIEACSGHHDCQDSLLHPPCHRAANIKGRPMHPTSWIRPTLWQVLQGKRDTRCCSISRTVLLIYLAMSVGLVETTFCGISTLNSTKLCLRTTVSTRL